MNEAAIRARSDAATEANESGGWDDPNRLVEALRSSSLDVRPLLDALAVRTKERDEARDTLRRVEALVESAEPMIPADTSRNPVVVMSVPALTISRALADCSYSANPKRPAHIMSAALLPTDTPETP